MSTQDSDDNESFECEQCGYESPTKRGLSVHQTSSHKNGNAKKEYTCDNCGDTFEDYESRRETRGREDFYCSKECKHEGFQKKKFYFECATCGDEVVRHPSSVEESNSDNYFCDRECASSFKSSEWVGEDHPSWVDNTVIRECSECGSDTEVNEYYLDTHENFFCDKECHDSFQINETHTDCHWCGEEFELTPRQRNVNSDHQFCSHDHWCQWMREQQKGENNSVWVGGKEKYYGPNWNESRQEVLERDDEQCQGCGMTREEHYDQNGRDLEVHHKKPLRTFDGNFEDANDSSNLITYCCACHGKAEQSS